MHRDGWSPGQRLIQLVQSAAQTVLKRALWLLQRRRMLGKELAVGGWCHTGLRIDKQTDRQMTDENHEEMSNEPMKSFATFFCAQVFREQLEIDVTKALGIASSAAMEGSHTAPALDNAVCPCMAMSEFSEQKDKASKQRGNKTKRTNDIETRHIKTTERKRKEVHILFHFL